MSARANGLGHPSASLTRRRQRYQCWCGYPACAGALHQRSRWHLLLTEPKAWWCYVRQGSRIFRPHRRVCR